MLLLGCCHPPALLAAEARNVLVLYSNNRLVPANIEIERGLRAAIASTPARPVNLYVEFRDEPNFGGEAYDRTLTTYLHDKFAAHPPDVIVSAGPEALDFLLGKRSGLFPRVPIVHLAVPNPILKSRPALPADVVGVPLDYDSVGTIEQALRWHPEARRLVVVTGATLPRDRTWEARLRGETSRFQGRVTVEFLSGLPVDVLRERLGRLGRDTVVFTPGFYQAGMVPAESAGLIALASSAPVYGPLDTFIGRGIVGGRMATFDAMGREAGGTVNALLDGASPASLRLPAITPTALHADWRQIRRWGIDTRDLPANAAVHFREPTLWEAYRNTVLIAVAVLLFQAALITALLLERRRRRRTAVALEDSEQRMSLAAHAGKLSMWIWDVARDRIWATSQLRQNAGLPNAQPADLTDVLATAHPADREALEQALRHAVEKGTELDAEYRVTQPDGGVRWIAVRGRAERGGGQRLLGVAQDITARKRAELQAEEDRAALRHMTRVSMMGQLSASIAHQLNQPLAAILGNAEAARKMLGRDGVDLAELREICDDIIAEDNRAAEVIRRLGALYKRGEMTLQPLDLNELVRETLDLVRTELLTRGVTVVIDLAPGLPPIDGGRVQLQQVLLNLILNAADAMGSVPTADRQLTIRTESAGADLRLTVTDRGTGIAPEHLESIFDAFWSTKQGGMGIGLAICRSIVAAHHGHLTAANQAGGGAVFCALLPVRAPA